MLLPHQHTHCFSLHNFKCILFTFCWQPTFPLLLLHRQHTECCSLTNFKSILFTVCWQPSFPLLLLPHQHTDCCSLHNCNYILFTVRWQLTFPQLLMPHQHVLTAVHYIILIAYCLQSDVSQHSHCCCCPTNTLSAAINTFELYTVYSPLTANIPTTVADTSTHTMLFTTQF